MGLSLRGFVWLGVLALKGPIGIGQCVNLEA